MNPTRNRNEENDPIKVTGKNDSTWYSQPLLRTLPPCEAAPEPPGDGCVLFLYPFGSNQEGVYGLPMSSELDSLIAQTLLHMFMPSVQVRTTHQVNMSPNGKLPFILLADGTCLSGDAVFYYIIAPSSPYVYPNQVLLKKPSALEGEIMAFTSLIRSKLSSAIAYSVWVEDDGYVKIAFPEHSSHWPFPLSWILTERKRSQVLSELHSLNAGHLNPDVILSEAKSALQTLSTRLGSSNRGFFFGGDVTSPTLVDAALFAHLHIILSTFLTGELKDAVLSHSNLVDYCKRMWTLYFQKESEEE